MNAFVALLLLAVAPAAAQAPEDGGVSQPEQKKARLICKKDPKTDTRMAKKICKTAAEWQQFQRTGTFDGPPKGHSPRNW